MADLLGNPVVGHGALADQIADHPGDELGMLRRRDLAVVGQTADIPQPADIIRPGQQIGDLFIAGKGFQRHLIVGWRRPGQATGLRGRVEAGAQCAEAGKIELVAAPLQHPHRLKAVALNGLDERVRERIDTGGEAEGAVAHMAAGAAGDLAQFGGGEGAVLVAVELAVGGESDMIDIEVEAHADGVGGDDEIDIAGLIDFHLLVAGARRERAQNDGRAATLAADQLGNGIDVVGGKGDDGGPFGQPRDLLLAGIGKHRHARPGDDLHARQQRLNDAAHGGGAQKQRFLAAAQIEDAVGEDMAAFQIGGQLHLVDGDKGGVGVARHGFDRGDPVTRLRGNDLFLAGDQRNLVFAGALGDALVDLTRQQPQRQADQT